MVEIELEIELEIETEIEVEIEIEIYFRELYQYLASQHPWCHILHLVGHQRFVPPTSLLCSGVPGSN